MSTVAGPGLRPPKQSCHREHHGHGEKPLGGDLRVLQQHLYPPPPAHAQDGEGAAPIPLDCNTSLYNLLVPFSINQSINGLYAENVMREWEVY